MEAFKGKWQCTKDDITGLDEYLAAIGQTGQKEMHSKNAVIELFNEGDKCCLIITHVGMPPMEYKCRIGERTEISYPGIGNVFVTMTLKDNVFYQKQEMGDVVVNCKSYIQDGIFVLEHTANGKTMVSRCKKM